MNTFGAGELEEKSSSMRSSAEARGYECVCVWGTCCGRVAGGRGLRLAPALYARSLAGSALAAGREPTL